MKRIFSVFLVMILCVGLITTASAGDANVNVTVNVTANAGCDCDCPGDQDPGCTEPANHCGPSKHEVRVAMCNIRLFSENVLDLLDRELQGSGWTRVGKAKRVLYKTNRIIYDITVEKEDGERISCYLIIRTPYKTIQKDVCGKCGKKKCIPYFVMFTWNYNTGCKAAEYEDSWLITMYDQGADDAIVEFVDLLVANKVVRR